MDKFERGLKEAAKEWSNENLWDDNPEPKELAFIGGGRWAAARSDARIKELKRRLGIAVEAFKKIHEELAPFNEDHLWSSDTYAVAALKEIQGEEPKDV